VAALDYWTRGRIRPYLATQVFNAVLVDRKAPTPRNNPLDHMLSALGQTGSLILFPEGGRFDGPDPVEFKPGLFYIAKKRPDLELVPVLLDNLNRILPRGEILPLPLIASVTFGAPIRLEEGEGRDPFLARARQAVVDLRNS
jgi:1-acyl-sn-glycerol-3-phosphate acyltransferase